MSISLALYLAIMQTAWYRTGKSNYLKMVKFWSKPFLICFAVGVVTGIVLEFEIGMNWSEYSRFVGDVFGAPLAMEALLAFFLEATFIGLWIFGWDRLPKGVHLACIWCVAIGTNCPPDSILTANSRMQNPVGFIYNAKSGQAELTDIWAVLTNKVAVAGYPHILAGALLSGAAVIVGIAAWHLTRRQHIEVMRASLRFGLFMALAAGIGTTITGDTQGKVMTEVQPMKMAAAEALWDSKSDASFSLFTIGTRDATREVFSVRIPFLLSFLAEGDIHANVEGINDLQAEYEQRFRARRLQTAHPHHLLELPLHDRAGWNHNGAGASRDLAHPPWQAACQPLDLAGVHLDDAAGDPGEHLRLDLHRDGPPAMGGVRRDAHPGGLIAIGARMAGGRLTRRVRRPLRRHRRRRGAPHPAVREAGPPPDAEPGSEAETTTPQLTFAY